jgi:hypothetical protein
MANTTNFNWETPDDTDLVKDGAAAIRTLGSAIDTSLVDLKGGTTGQVLSKATNTDMDFTWVAQDDSNAIQNALLTTTGDTIYASGASTPARLGIGTTGQVLTVAGGVPSWATPGGGLTYSAWTPSYTNLSVGNGTEVARYAQSGKFVHCIYSLTFGSTTSISGGITISLPQTAAQAVGSTTAFFDDAGTAGYTGMIQMTSTTAVAVYYIGAATAYTQFFNLSSSLPFTWTTGDKIAFQLSYEAA